MRTLSTLATLLMGLAFVFWAPAANAHCPGHTHCDEEPSTPGETLGDLSCSTDQIARYDGTNWVCSTGALTCISGQVAKFNGSNWACAADEDTDTNTDTLADLPSCIDGDVAKFDGAVWNCESSAPGPLIVRDLNETLVGTIFEFSGKDVRDDGSVTIAMQMEVAGVPRIFVINGGESGFKAGGGGMFSEDDSCGDPLYKALNGALSNLERASFHDGFAFISETGSGPVFIDRNSFLDNGGVCSGPSPRPDDGPYFLMVEVDLSAFTPPFSAGF